ncbi:MAG: type II toxin-antitoxin system RelE/ParE family toxin [Rhodothermaceae bacterium]|nr:type II toxin-antitoxin system RelE/ParE family toxin [Rhodothermaceae bacterium]
MINSFNDKATEELFTQERSRRYPQKILKRALRKLFLIDAAIVLEDLKAPYGNRLEALKGDRIGQHSIRINRGWRICFEWREDGVYNVEINNHYE